MHAPEEKRLNLLENESFWLYNSDTMLHKFCEQATMDTKQALLCKLGFHFAMTIYDDTMGCDRSKWIEQIAAARGSEEATEWNDRFIHASSTFIIGSFEINRILNRLDVIHNSKMRPISRYIKRLRDYKRLGNYENLHRQSDFIYFILKVCVGFTRYSTAESVFGITNKELIILIYFYFEHRILRMPEIREAIGDIYPQKKVITALANLVKAGYLERMSHPYKWKATNKNFTWSMTEKGQEVIMKLCTKIFQYV